MKPPITWRHALPMLVLLVAVPRIDLANAGGGTHTIVNGTIAGGGHVAVSSCYAIVSTVGEPVAGTVSNGTYRLTAGFPATIGAAQLGSGTHTLFKDSFEGNDQGGCTP